MEKNQDLKIERHGSDMDLRTFLSQTFVVYMKTYALHWNYEGPRFYGVHHLTEMQYQDMAEAIDQIAERMRALGNEAPVSLKQILEHSDMKEYKAHADNDSSLKELVQAHRQLSQMAKAIASSAEKMDDAYSHDLLVQRSGAHDKFAWMLQSLL